jgi:hypothetical protein
LEINFCSRQARKGRKDMQVKRSAFEHILLQELGELCELGVKCLISKNPIHPVNPV